MTDKKARSNYVVQFTKKTYQRYEVRFNKVKEPAIIEALQSKGNINEYIRTLILEDIRKNG